MAAASVHIMEIPSSTWSSKVSPMCSHINVGSGIDYTIAELATLIAKTVGYGGNIIFDSSKPDGAPRKWMDSTILFELGWSPTFNLENGLIDAYDWYLNNIGVMRSA
jgi:GDP-L-fucose synthase